MQEKERKKSQEKRIILTFLREQAVVLLWVVFFIGIFCLLCFLENVPQDVTVYTLQLAFFSGIAVLLFRFIRYRKRCKTLELLTTDPRDKIEAFPKPDTLPEKLYRQIIGQYERELRKEQQQMDDRYREMVEYYTMWTHQIKTPIAAMRLLLQEEETPVSREMQGGTVSGGTVCADGTTVFADGKDEHGSGICKTGTGRSDPSGSTKIRTSVYPSKDRIAI